MSIITAIMVLSVLIIVHEIGHFTVAKLCNIKVLEFSLFMGPKLLGFKKGETQYSLRLIPLGGYVKMEGEEQASDDARAFSKQPVWKRWLVIVAGPVMNIITALVFVSVILAVNGYYTTKVSSVQKDSPAYTAGLQPGDIIRSYDGKKIYHPNDMPLFLYGTNGKSTIIQYEREGELISNRISPEIFPANRYLIGFTSKEFYGADSNLVQEVSKDSPAEKAGILPGDRIIAVNGIKTGTRTDISAQFYTHKGEELTLSILRSEDGKMVNVYKKVVPYLEKSSEQYITGFDYNMERGGVLSIVKNSAVYSFSIARNVYYTIVWLIKGRVGLNQLSGPVGIVNSIGTVVKESPDFASVIMNLLGISSFISIYLGIFNLLPFPALDGSKLIIYLIEAVRRKALPPEKEAIISIVGLSLLMILMIYATFNDILRLTGG